MFKLSEHETASLVLPAHDWQSPILRCFIIKIKLGQSLEKIAGQYDDLTLADVHVAMAYDYDHRGEFDQSIADDETLAEVFRRSNPSLLQAKLRAMSCGCGRFGQGWAQGPPCVCRSSCPDVFVVKFWR